MPNLSIVAAIGTRGELGARGSIPWLGHLRRDLSHFKDITRNGVMIMGRKTADSIRLPLPSRMAVIITRKVNEANERHGDHSTVVSSLESAIYACNELIKNNPKLNQDEIFVIGGAQLYNEVMENNIIETIHLTRVHSKFTCDTSFNPDLSRYELISSEFHAADQKNLYDCTFETYKRSEQGIILPTSANSD